MAKKTESPRPAAETEAVVPVVETLDPEHPVPVVVEPAPEVEAVAHVAVSEGEEFAAPKAILIVEDEPAPISYTNRLITELGLQPVALASRTYASDFGPGGAASTYRTLVYDNNGAILATNEVKFQNGEVYDASAALDPETGYIALTPSGINGISDSTLLSIVADRLTAFQAGPFACEQNGKALACIHEAAVWLNARTVERQTRGVEGKHEA